MTLFIRTLILISLLLPVGEILAEKTIPIPQWHMTQMTQDRQGMMWFGTWNGLCRFDGYDFVMCKNKPGDGIQTQSDRVRNLVLGKDGNLYCRVEDEILCFNLTTYQYEKTTVKDLKAVAVSGHGKTPDADSYKAQGYRQAFTDQQGNLWLLKKYGVTKTVKRNPPMQRLDCVPKNTVRCMYHDARHHQIWVGTKEDGIVTLLDEDGNLKGYLGPDGRIGPAPKKLFSAYGMVRTDENTLWIGCKPEGLFRLHQQKGDSYTIERIESKEIADASVYDLKLDSKGRLWAAIHGKGIFLCVNPKAEKPVFTPIPLNIKSQSKEIAKVRRVYPTPDAKRVIVASVGGLIVIDGTEGNDVSKYRSIVHRREPNRASSLNSSATMNVIFAGENAKDMYVSTENGGIEKLLSSSVTDPQLDFQHLGYRQGICSDDVLSITPMGDDIIIICLDDVAIYNTRSGQSRNYNTDFWCEQLRFSEASPIQLTGNRWLFPLEDGVIMVDENVFMKDAYIPKIAISSLKIEDNATLFNVNHLDTLILQPDERNVEFTFAALDFAAEENLSYQTSLNDREWSAPSENHTLVLYDLKPGTYKLRIRSTNAQGLWTDNVRELTIIVKPQWYETLWAQMLYLLLFVIIVSGITYLIIYIRTINKQRSETLEAYLDLMEKMQQEDTHAMAEDVARELPKATVTIKHSAEDEAFISKLMVYVESNIGNSDAGIDDMAAAVMMSRSSMTRKMKQLTGVTPSDFLRKARMKHACQMLRSNTHHSTSDVAYACGFSDPKYFAKCFKAAMGVSPREYRDSARMV